MQNEDGARELRECADQLEEQAAALDRAKREEAVRRADRPRSGRRNSILIWRRWELDTGTAVKIEREWSAMR
jgi:hypothetical protein